MRVCNVCSETVPKYRCPTCKIRYCSVICYKKHKDGCLPVEETPPAVLPKPGGSWRRDGDWTVEDLVDEEDESDKVPLERLKKLGESEELKALLHNAHLRRLLLAVDGAENKADIMKVAMQEPLFVEFADQCLRIAEPMELEDF